MRRSKRTLGAGVALAIGALALAACGNGDGGDSADPSAYPSDDITLVIPWAPGGGTDVVGRALAEAMDDLVDVNVVVENRDGAGSATGSAYVQDSDPDGLTLLLNSPSVITQTFVTQAEGTDSVDYEKLIPIANVNADPYTMQVSTDRPWKSLSEMIDYAKANPGEIQIGAAGVGSHSELFIPILEDATGAEFDEVVFDGSGPANVALVGHHIDAHAPSLGDFASYIDDGSVRLLAIAADERDPLYPDVPTFKEEGVDVSFGLFRGVWGPAGMSDELVAAVEKLVLDAAESDSFQGTLEDLSYGKASWDHERFQQEVDQQVELLETTMREQGLI